MLVRRCPRCDTVKDIEDFSIDASRKSGRQCYCRECQLKIYEGKKEKAKKQRQARYAANKDKEKLKMKEYYSSNRAGYRERNALRRASKLSATPSWLTLSDLCRIKSIYIEAQELSKSSGKEWHVDHIVPLQHERVCGLHVPWNLQIITATENYAKSNKFEE
jgi:5-methylcytosine-specific restriction endonuclease McrA